MKSRMPKFIGDVDLGTALDVLYMHNILMVENEEVYLRNLLERACRPGEDPDTWGEYDKAVFKFLRA